MSGGAEPGEVTDRRHDRQRNRGIHPGDGHQPQHLRPPERGLAQVGVDQGQLLAVEVELPQQGASSGLLIGWQILSRQPHPALDPEQVGGRAPWHQVAGQDGVHLVLQPRALLHDVRPAQHLPAQRIGGRIRQPHRRQVVRGQQLRQDLRVDLVGLHLRLSDRPGLGRVRYHHPPGMAGQQGCDRPRVPGRFQRHLIGWAQARGELTDPFWRRGERARLNHHPALPDRHLREITVHIQPDTPPGYRHRCSPFHGS